jgi:hypothetical protein
MGEVAKCLQLKVGDSNGCTLLAQPTNKGFAAGLEDSPFSLSDPARRKRSRRLRPGRRRKIPGLQAQVQRRASDNG